MLPIGTYFSYLLKCSLIKLTNATMTYTEIPNNSDLCVVRNGNIYSENLTLLIYIDNV